MCPELWIMLPSTLHWRLLAWHSWDFSETSLVTGGGSSSLCVGFLDTAWAPGLGPPSQILHCGDKAGSGGDRAIPTATLKMIWSITHRSVAYKPDSSPLLAILWGTYMLLIHAFLLKSTQTQFLRLSNKKHDWSKVDPICRENKIANCASTRYRTAYKHFLCII